VARLSVRANCITVLFFVVCGIACCAAAQTCGDENLLRPVCNNAARGNLHTPSDFTAHVHFRMRPFVSVRVLVTDLESGSYGRVVATAETDFDGMAHFFAIPPGKYQVRLDAPILAPRQDIEVVPGMNYAMEIDLPWPGWTPVARRAEGRMCTGEHPSAVEKPVRSALQNGQLELLDLRSGKLVAVTRTNQDGYYEFKHIRDGLYVLRVEADDEPGEHRFEQAVEVRSASDQGGFWPFEVNKVCGELNVTLLEPQKSGGVILSLQ